MQSSLAQRQHMIQGQLITNDVLDKRILQAMIDIPRDAFVPDALKGAAYVDDDLEISEGRYLLAPLVFARLMELAEITLKSRVLVIGCLSGYTAAIVARLAGSVVATDTDPEFLIGARDRFEWLTINNIELQQVQSLADGYSAKAPYDAIVICGAVNNIPKPLGAQLAVDGRLVAVRNIAQRPGVKGGLGKGFLVRKIDNRLQYREHFDASTALLAGFEL